MSSPRVQANPQSSLPFGDEAKPGFRTKTAATRLTPTNWPRSKLPPKVRDRFFPSGYVRRLCAPRDSSPLIQPNWCWPKSGRCVTRCLISSMQPPKPQRKVDNCCPIPSSKSATKPTRESSIRLANFSKNSLPARARKELVCHECHAFSQKLFALDAVALGSRDVPFAPGCAECVAEPVLT
jgi:hypothetical protein